MPPLGTDILNPIGTPDDAQAQFARLREEFDYHNHDGVNSRNLANIIAESITTRVAIIGGLRLFQATVGPTQADYKTVAEALNAGKTRIFVRNGTYANEPRWVISNANTVIQGESESGVIITFGADAVNAQNVRISTSNFICENMTLTAYEATAHTLFFFTSTGLYPIIQRLILRNKRGPCFEGDVPGGQHVKAYGVFRDIYINMKTTLDTSLQRGFIHLDECVADNIFFDQTGSSQAGNIISESCINILFTACRVRADFATNLPSILTSEQTKFVGCYFYCTSMIAEATFVGCFFENNGSDPATYAVSGYFIDLDTINTSIISSSFKLTNSFQFLNIAAAGVIFSNNYISGGKKIIVNAGAAFHGVVIAHNIWRSDYTTAAINLTLGANSNHVNLLGNVFHGATNTPTITDSGTNNNSVSNQLYFT